MEDSVMEKTKKTFSLRSVVMAVLPFLSIALLLAIWLAASSVDSDLVPSPLMVWQRLLRTFEKKISGQLIYGHIWASLQRVFLALLLSMSVGIPLGFAIGWNKKMRASLGTLFELIRPIPPIAWLPLVIMWLGIGELPKVVIVFIGTLSPIVVNTAAGIRMIDPINVNVGKMFNANGRQLIFEICLPSALPSIVAGFRTATSSGLMVVLAAEMIGAKAGLGFLITRGMESFDVPLIMVGMLTIALVGVLLSIMTDFIERWLCPWARNAQLD